MGNLLKLSLGALGVVYGDIGTSPLYAINEIFFGHAGIVHNLQNILGGISLVIWSLSIIVAFKYIIYVLRADNDGEGGVFALYGLLSKKKFKGGLVVTTLLIFAAGLLYGDGIITPAISVISAVEGLKGGVFSLNETRAKFDSPKLEDDYFMWSLGNVLFNPDTKEMFVPNMQGSGDLDEGPVNTNSAQPGMPTEKPLPAKQKPKPKS